MHSPPGFMNALDPTWVPSRLGSALVFAGDPNNAASAVDDGTGHCQNWKDLYNPSTNSIDQATSTYRPAIVSSSGILSAKKTLQFDTASTAWFLATSSSNSALANLWNTSDLTTNYGTVIMAARLNTNLGSAQFMAIWTDAPTSSPTQWFQIRQNVASLNLNVNSTTQSKTWSTPNVAQQTGWHLLTAVKNGPTARFRMDGSERGSVAVTASMTFTGGYLIIGTSGSGVVTPGSTQQLKNMGGLLITNTALSGNDLANAESWVRKTVT